MLLHDTHYSDGSCVMSLTAVGILTHTQMKHKQYRQQCNFRSMMFKLGFMKICQLVCKLLGWDGHVDMIT
jgi:hypothetical protein